MHTAMIRKAGAFLIAMACLAGSIHAMQSHEPRTLTIRLWEPGYTWSAQ